MTDAEIKAFKKIKDFKIEVEAAPGKKAYNKIIALIVILLIGIIVTFVGIKRAEKKTINIKDIKRIEATETGALIHFKDNSSYYIEYIGE